VLSANEFFDLQIPSFNCAHGCASAAPVRQTLDAHIDASSARGNLFWTTAFYAHLHCCNELEVDMGFGRGVLLWLIGVPIPIILLIALFWHH
jgi:hypothetical protein